MRTDIQFPHIHQVDSRTVRFFFETYRPVFVLSTGRCGSRWIVELFRLGAAVDARHEPRPALMHQAGLPLIQSDSKVLEQVVLAARFEAILESFIRGRTYVESNQCLNFFLPTLARLFPQARFIHLIRHPGDFCASAVRKGWYRNDSIWESGRIRPRQAEVWSRKSQVEKLCWYWTVVNHYLHHQGALLGPERFRTARLEDLTDNGSLVRDLLSFAGLEGIPEEHLARIQSRPLNQLEAPRPEPPNMKKRHRFSVYPQWKPELRALLGRSSLRPSVWGYTL